MPEATSATPDDLGRPHAARAPMSPVSGDAAGGYDADVLIVGAGPTGLSLAIALVAHGTSVVVVEARASVSRYTKATNLMPGTLEQLSVYGLAEAMYARGGRMDRYMIGLYGANVGPREMDLRESPHARVLFLGQDRIDANLEAALLDSGNAVRFGHRLTHLEQDGDGVRAEVAADGDVHHWRFRYAVGCDGPKSTTRTFTRADFEPVRTGKYVWQADATLHWKRLKSMRQMWLYYYDEGFGAVIHLPGGVSKVMAFEPKDSLPNREPTLVEMEAKLRAMSGDGSATLTDAKWLSHGELLTGVAPTLIDGRILLAGDACNPILPNGGQGLNIGIQDALNLAWKLSDVIEGYAGTALLDTYDAERRALRIALEKVQLSTLKYTLPAPRLNRWLLGRFGGALLNRFWGKLARVFGQLNLEYAGSPLTQELLGKGGAVRAGYRVLDAEVVRARDNAEVSLFEELAAPRWKLLLFDAGAAATPDERLFGPAFGMVDRYIITSSLATEYPAPTCYYDIDEVTHQVYGVREAQYLLVRPDNYVAVRCGVGEADEVVGYWRRWFGAAATEPVEVAAAAA